MQLALLAWMYFLLVLSASGCLVPPDLREAGEEGGEEGEGGRVARAGEQRHLPPPLPASPSVLGCSAHLLP